MDATRLYDEDEREDLRRSCVRIWKCDGIGNDEIARRLGIEPAELIALYPDELLQRKDGAALMNLFFAARGGDADAGSSLLVAYMWREDSPIADLLRIRTISH